MFGMPRQLALSVAIGLPVFGAAAFLGPRAMVGPDTASAQYDNCGFPPDPDDRSIALRRHISCAEAKRVLLRLKGDRRSHTVPMVCVRPRVIQGWRLSNGGRAFGVVFTHYRRGRISFSYQRIDHLGRRAWCRPPYGSGEDVG
jgi:hypothetical protein